MVTRTERQPAFLLHRRAYRETSFILELFTREHGRLAAVARGGRGARGPAWQPFQPLSVSWSGRSEMKTLGSVEAASPVALAGERLYCGLYLNELLMRLLPPHDAHPPLFDAYARLLAELVHGDIELLLRRFELMLLRELGYGLELDREEGTGAVLEPAARYVFSPDAGLRRADERELKGVFTGSVLEAIAREDFSETETRRQAKQLLRQALAPLLGDKPLRSREYFVQRGG